MANIYYSIGRAGERIKSPYTSVEKLRCYMAKRIIEGKLKSPPIYFWSGPKTENEKGIFVADYTLYGTSPIFYWVLKDSVWEYAYHYRLNRAISFKQNKWNASRVRERIKE